MYYFLNFFILVFVELIYLKIANKFMVFDIPNERSSHQFATIKGGGVIFLICVLNWFFFENHDDFYFFLSGLFIISIVSFIDDILI